LLKDVLVKEKVDWISEPILKKIYDASEGCPRESLKILDQVVDLQTEEEMEAAICSMSYEETQINDLWNVLLSAKPQWNKVRKILENMDLSNHEGLRKAMLTRMSNLMLKSDNPHAATIFDCFKDPFYNTLKAGFINACYQSVVMLDLD
jgi:DNA polymerase III gamma/tau subunit